MERPEVTHVVEHRRIGGGKTWLDCSCGWFHNVPTSQADQAAGDHITAWNKRRAVKRTMLDGMDDEGLYALAKQAAEDRDADLIEYAVQDDELVVRMFPRSFATTIRIVPDVDREVAADDHEESRPDALHKEDPE